MPSLTKKNIADMIHVIKLTLTKIALQTFKTPSNILQINSTRINIDKTYEVSTKNYNFGMFTMFWKASNLSQAKQNLIMLSLS